MRVRARPVVIACSEGTGAAQGLGLPAVDAVLGVHGLAVLAALAAEQAVDAG